MVVILELIHASMHDFEEACVYDDNTDEEVAFPWTLENMTLNSAA